VQNIALDSWELWNHKGGGGWHHPLHIHLIDYYNIEVNGKLPQYYQFLVPKDMTPLWEGYEIRMQARYHVDAGQLPPRFWPGRTWRPRAEPYTSGTWTLTSILSH
jgi:FtsP/CotA-like multicopper oxidase with cupredoxin domain